MATIKPFKGLRPTPALAPEVATLPYDVVSVPEAREFAKQANNFYHATTHQEPRLLLRSGKKKEMHEEQLDFADAVDVTSWKAIGTGAAGADLKEVVPVSDEDAPTLF